MPSRLAPLPPSKFLSPLPPSETPPPKRYTYCVIPDPYAGGAAPGREAPTAAANKAEALIALSGSIAAPDGQDLIKTTRNPPFRQRNKSDKSAFDLREVGDFVHCITHPREQVEPRFALGGVGIVDRHLVEERVDRRAERGERGHRGFEILALDRGDRLGLGAGERCDE